MQPGRSRGNAVEVRGPTAFPRVRGSRPGSRRVRARTSHSWPGGSTAVSCTRAAHSWVSADGGEAGEHDDVGLVVPRVFVEGSATGDQALTGVVDVAVDLFGREVVLGVFLDAVDAEGRDGAVGAVDDDGVPGAQLPEPVKAPGSPSQSTWPASTAGPSWPGVGLPSYQPSAVACRQRA